MRSTFVARMLVLAIFSGTLMSLGGCFAPKQSEYLPSGPFENSLQVQDWIHSPTSEFYTQNKTPAQQWEVYRRTLDLNERGLRDDIIQFWLMDRPSRASMNMIP